MRNFCKIFGLSVLRKVSYTILKLMCYGCRPLHFCNFQINPNLFSFLRLCVKHKALQFSFSFLLVFQERTGRTFFSLMLHNSLPLKRVTWNACECENDQKHTTTIYGCSSISLLNSRKMQMVESIG